MLPTVSVLRSKLFILFIIFIFTPIIMALPNKYTEIQTAVAYIVTHPQLQDKLCTFERLARPLNVLADTMNNNNIAKVDIKLLKQVFKDKNGAVQYTVSYDDLEVNNTQLRGRGTTFYSSDVIRRWGEKNTMRLGGITHG